MRALLLVTLLCAACPSKSSPTPVSTPAAERSVVIPAGKTYSQSFPLTSGGTFSLAYEATDILLWRIEREAQVYEQGEGTAGTIRFTATVDGTYTITFQNDNSTSVKLTLR